MKMSIFSVAACSTESYWQHHALHTITSILTGNPSSH